MLYSVYVFLTSDFELYTLGCAESENNTGKRQFQPSTCFHKNAGARACVYVCVRVCVCVCVRARVCVGAHVFKHTHEIETSQPPLGRCVRSAATAAASSSQVRCSSSLVLTYCVTTRCGARDTGAIGRGAV